MGPTSYIKLRKNGSACQQEQFHTEQGEKRGGGNGEIQGERDTKIREIRRHKIRRYEDTYEKKEKKDTYHTVRT